MSLFAISGCWSLGLFEVFGVLRLGARLEEEIAGLCRGRLKNSRHAHAQHFLPFSCRLLVFSISVLCGDLLPWRCVEVGRLLTLRRLEKETEHSTGIVGKRWALPGPRQAGHFPMGALGENQLKVPPLTNPILPCPSSLFPYLLSLSLARLWASQKCN